MTKDKTEQQRRALEADANAILKHAERKGGANSDLEYPFTNHSERDFSRDARRKLFALLKSPEDYHAHYGKTHGSAEDQFIDQEEESERESQIRQMFAELLNGIRGDVVAMDILAVADPKIFRDTKALSGATGHSEQEITNAKRRLKYQRDKLAAPDVIFRSRKIRRSGKW